MSKAFTREDAPSIEGPAPYSPPWPDGARNYVTPAGLTRLRTERERLLSELPSAVERGEIERRLQILGVHIEAAEVVEVPIAPDRVAFATEVTVRDADDRTRVYSIVGIDDADAAAGRVSWLSPIARALRGAKVGDVVTLRVPRGEEELEVERIAPVDDR